MILLVMVYCNDFLDIIKENN